MREAIIFVIGKVAWQRPSREVAREPVVPSEDNSADEYRGVDGWIARSQFGCLTRVDRLV